MSGQLREQVHRDVDTLHEQLQPFLNGSVLMSDERAVLAFMIGQVCGRYEIAARLGSTAKTPALQLRRGRVLAKTAQRVTKVHKEMVRDVVRLAEIRREISDAAGLGSEWFDAEAFSIITRGGRADH